MDKNEIMDSDHEAFLHALFEHLSNEGYSITETEIENFIRLTYEEGGLFSGDEDENMQRLESLLRPLIVKNGKEDADFHDTVKEFAKKSYPAFLHKRELQNSIGEKEKELVYLSEKCKSEKAAADEASDIPVFISEAYYRELEDSESRGDFLNEIQSFPQEEISFIENLNSYAFGILGEIPYEDPFFKECISSLTNLMKKCILMPSGKALMEYTAKEISVIKTIQKGAESPLNIAKHKYEQTALEKENAEQEMEDMRKEYSASVVNEIYKDKSFKHREEFIGGKNAVHSNSLGEITEYGKGFKKITEQEQEEIKNYILAHKEEFKSHLARYITAGRHRQINVPETCRNALRYGSVPLKLSYTKPIRKKAKIAMILDISGSCSAASEMMLYFMYCMKECVPAGCLVYVFINKLHDVTEIFKNAPNADEATKEVLNTIPRAGAYSDYGKVFREFASTEISKISRTRTYTFVIGDARNNKNDPDAEDFGKICSKSQKTYWLNTDPKEMWNQGDSVIDEYRKYVDSCIEAQSPAQMLNLFRTIS